MDYDTGAILGLAAGYMIVMLAIVVAVYVVSSLGFYKLYKLTKFEDKAWMAWVPIANILILAWFLADENECPEWQKWVMSLYWLCGIIPVIGYFAVLAGSIFIIVQYFKFMGKYNAPGWHYVMIFVFSIILPWLWQGYYTNGDGGDYTNYNTYTDESAHTGRRVYH